MISLRRNAKRRFVQRGKQNIWYTFYKQEQPDPLNNGFGLLTHFDETHFPPRKSRAAHVVQGTDIITYVYQGALGQKDANGNTYLIHAGEFQHLTIDIGSRLKEANALQSHWTQIFRIRLRPCEQGYNQANQHSHFTAAQRRNLLCPVVSPDGRQGSLCIKNDVVIYSSILDQGHHLVHQLQSKRRVWLHIVCGNATLNDLVLFAGDGIGVEGQPSVSLTVQENAEILVVDLGPG